MARWLPTLMLAAILPARAGEIYAYATAGSSVLLTNIPDRAGATPASRAPDARSTRGQPYREHVAQAARELRLDQALLEAVIAVESNYAPAVVSRKGAVGLMQLMPDTARRFGALDATDPAQNIRAGARYLRYLLDVFRGDLELALAAYNAGEGNVLRHGSRVPPFPETIEYVRKVRARYEPVQPN
jgi:soluble lytic murein transglycosylase-like protein